VHATPVSNPGPALSSPLTLLARRQELLGRVGDCGRCFFVLSRGYTEQQEWVWSLSSTLGREDGKVTSVHVGRGYRDDKVENKDQRKMNGR
jgi:hypothetical protein